MSNVGRVLYGNCEGVFGRDSYATKRIEAEGFDWIVVRDIQETAPGYVQADFAAFSDPTEKARFVAKNSERPDDGVRTERFMGR